MSHVQPTSTLAVPGAMATETTGAGLVPRNGGDSTPPEDSSQLYQPFQRKPKRLKKDGTPYKPRKGWGPYRSVPNERAAAFNLQLDVQNLQQEIRNLSALRDVLRSKPLIQRHSPEGSLMQVVKEYFRVFRTGPAANNAVGEANMTSEQQCDFLYSIVDPEVDVGMGLHGPDVMVYQLDMYSTLLRWIKLEMNSFEIVEAEDSVVVKASSTFTFQVLRETIRMIFPHVIGDEWLVAQLVGKTVEARMDITFYFNAEGKCCKLVVDTDYVGAFASIVKDPEIVDKLLGRALIADNSMLGLIEEPPEIDTDFFGPASEVANDAGAGSSSDQAEKVSNGVVALASPYSRPTYHDIQSSCLQTVNDYYLAFADGYQAEDSAKAPKLAIAFQRDFLVHRFASRTAHGNNYTSVEYVEQRWRSLSECFSVLGFHQKSLASVEIHHHVGTCVISSSARYTLRITPVTIRSVFPHIETHSQLYEALVGEVVAVPSQLHFSIEIETGRICRLEERMDFAVGMASVIASRQELDFVLSGANLTLDGVSL